MSKGGNKTTTTQGLDPGSQRYVDQMRRYAQGAVGDINGPLVTGPQTQTIAQQAAPFFNPYQENVLGALDQHYDALRHGAVQGADQTATQANAFGGSRHGVLAGIRSAELDRAQMSDTANLLHSGYQNAVSQGTAYAEHQRQLQEQQLREPLMRAQAGLGLFGAGMGPTGMTSTVEQPSTMWKDIAGLGLTAAGFLFPPAGAAKTAGTAMAGLLGGAKK